MAQGRGFSLPPATAQVLWAKPVAWLELEGEKKKKKIKRIVPARRTRLDIEVAIESEMAKVVGMDNTVTCPCGSAHAISIPCFFIFRVYLCCTVASNCCYLQQLMKVFVIVVFELLAHFYDTMSKIRVNENVN